MREEGKKRGRERREGGRSNKRDRRMGEKGDLKSSCSKISTHKPKSRRFGKISESAIHETS